MVRLFDFQIASGGVLYLVTEFVDNHHHLSDLARLQISPNLQMIVKVGFAACSFYDWFVKKGIDHQELSEELVLFRKNQQPVMNIPHRWII